MSNYQSADELIEKARLLAEFGREWMEDNRGSLSHQFHLLCQDHEEIVVAEGKVTNDPQAKYQFGRALRARVARGDVLAVLMLSDTYYSRDMTPERERMRRGFGMSLKQAADAGLCTVVEAVVVSVESPILLWMGMRAYRRVEGPEGKGTVIEWTGEMDVMTNSQGEGNLKGMQVTGNFMGLFGARGDDKGRTQ